MGSKFLWSKNGSESTMNSFGDFIFGLLQNGQVPQQMEYILHYEGGKVTPNLAPKIVRVIQ